MKPRILGILIILYIAALNIPYTLLAINFDYDNVLREPAGEVLTKFAAGGSSLVLTWFAFGMGALLFVPLAGLIRRVFSKDEVSFLAETTTAGILSGVLQAFGLMRWAFVIPIIAATYSKPESTPVMKEAALMAYSVLNQYGGVVVGEHLGQMLLCFWTFGISRAILITNRFSRLLGWFGMLSCALWLGAQLELISTTVPELPVVEVVPVAFILWQVWLLSFGIILINNGKPAKLLNRPVHPRLSAGAGSVEFVENAFDAFS